MNKEIIGIRISVRIIIEEKDVGVMMKTNKKKKKKMKKCDIIMDMYDYTQYVRAFLSISISVRRGSECVNGRCKVLLSNPKTFSP